PAVGAGRAHVLGAPPVVLAVADVDQAEALAAPPVVADVPRGQPGVLEGGEGEPADVAAVPVLLGTGQLAADGGAEAIGADEDVAPRAGAVLEVHGDPVAVRLVPGGRGTE